MTQVEDAGTPEAGSVPLKSLKHEVYCQQRVLNCPPEIAAQRAGYPARSGMYSKLERRQDVQARLAFLRKDEDEIIRRKRQRIEEELSAVVDFDIVDFATISEETGALQSIDWRKVRDSGMSRMVSEFAFDAKTGELTRFKRDDRLNAIAQLRDMHGFKAPTKTALTNPDGDGPAEVNFNITDEDRAKALMAFLAKHKLKGEAA